MNAFEPIRTMPMSCLNLGSGKDFRASAFNIDVDDSWCPDAVLDLSAIDIDDGPLILQTQRFGYVRLESGCFNRIVANDVLEHVPDLMRLMTTCLNLLRVGGQFEISVPYDLSFGAWQDPTHVRAFNERSWLYYTDWFWYMGWNTARFVLDHLQFVPSPIGEELQRQGHARDAVLTTPRAIDSMSVVLRKVELSPEDKTVWSHWRDRRRQAQVSNHAAIQPAAVNSQLEKATELVPFHGSWTRHADRYCVWSVTLPGYDHGRAFDEVAVALSQGFVELGGSAPITHHAHEWHGRIPIILGAHLLPTEIGQMLPADSVVYNFEQASRSSTWLTEAYLDLLRRHQVLDYSVRNTAAMHAFGIEHARTLPMGYTDDLSSFAPASIQDIDVLFYGSLNERRAKLLDRLRAEGLAVTHLFDVYGAERNAAIARAKIVLNMHFYEAAVFESVRVTHLLANGACVVTEGLNEDPDLAHLLGGLAVCGYDELVPCCVALLANDASRSALATTGGNLIRKRRQADLLQTFFFPP